MSESSYLGELQRLRSRLDALLEQAMEGPDYGSAVEGAPGSWSPVIDLFETPDEYVLLAELPGVVKSDVNLEVNSRQLVLSGHRAHPERAGTFHRMERSYGKFFRAFQLNHDVDAESVEARLDRGLLRIRIAKQNRDNHGSVTVSAG